MSKDRRRKLERRANRKREREERLRDLRARVAAKTHTCPDCGDDYREDRPTDFHRKGPCGAPKERVEALQRELDAIQSRWDKAEADEAWVDTNGATLQRFHLSCRSCRRSIIQDQESWRVCEGLLLWVGCDFCHEVNDARVEDEIVAIRLSWPEVQAKISEIEKHVEEEARRRSEDAKKRFDKYVAPFMKPENQVVGIAPKPIPFSVAAASQSFPPLPEQSRSIYDRAMDEPVPFPELPTPASE